MITKLNPEALPDNSITNAKLDTELVNKVNNKQDKLTAGTGIEISPDNNISCTLDTTVFTVVDSLPTTPEAANINKIHLIKESTVEGNLFSEYLWVEGKWEKLGDFRPSVDLSGYAKLDKNNTFEYQQFFDSDINIKGSIFFSPVLNDASAMGQKIQNLQGAASTSKTGLIIRDAYDHNTPLYGILVPEDPYDTSCAVNKAYVDNIIQQMQATIDTLTQRVAELETSLNEISYVEEETTTSETTK